MTKVRSWACTLPLLAALTAATACAAIKTAPQPPRLVLRGGDEKRVLVGSPGGGGPFTDISARIAEPGRNRIGLASASGDTVVFRVCAVEGNTLDFRYGMCQLVARNQRTWAERWRSDPRETVWEGSVDPSGENIAYLARERVCMLGDCLPVGLVARARSLTSGAETDVARFADLFTASSAEWTSPNQLLVTEHTGEFWDERTTTLHIVDPLAGVRRLFLATHTPGVILWPLGGVSGPNGRILIVRQTRDAREIAQYDDSAILLWPIVSVSANTIGVPIWNPVAARVVWTDGDRLLSISTLAPGASVEVLYEEPDAKPNAPSFSPNGTLLAFAADSPAGPRTKILTIDLDRKPYMAKVVTQTEGSGVSPAGWMAGDLDWLP